ncbi:hypothetical protein ACJMK2_036256 [Sinanodonta woodiana]|uniref:Prospero domain-containing protein n=1 Tax=Sinanodonta woodiana TaxID=1069815 RepID=A0ABD3WK46_SINWO
MVNIDQPLTDTSNLLRNILKTKEKRLQDLSNANVMPGSTCGPPKTPTENGTENVNGDEQNDGVSDHSADEFGDQSDEESSLLGQSRLDEAEIDEARSDAENGFSDFNPSPSSDTKEAKRARVENIITSMQGQPSQDTVESSYGFSEVKRPKRKQYQPQPHVTKPSDLHQQEQPSPKIRRTDCNSTSSVEDEIWQLRYQLNAVQNYIKHCDETTNKQMNGYGCIENIQRLHQAYFANQSPGQPPRFLQDRTFDDKSELYTKEKHESRISTSNIKVPVVNGKRIHHEESDSHIEIDDKEYEELTKCLKSRIGEAVSSAIEKALSKFFHRRSQKVREESKLTENQKRNEDQKKVVIEKKQTTDHSLKHILQLPERTNGFRLPEHHSAFDLPKLGGHDFSRTPFPHHPSISFHPPLSYYLPSHVLAPPVYPSPVEPEQTEALALVVTPPKKKRTKVTDTRLSPRAARALLQESSLGSQSDLERMSNGEYSSMIPGTSVAIPNPSLHHSDFMSFYKEQSMLNHSFDLDRCTPSSSISPNEGFHSMKNDIYDGLEVVLNIVHTDTLTPMHLRKAKLMFFYVRYPSSAILKVYFPDVQFNKNNTAQLVKWFSNFREFFYIQMEKYARQALAEGIKHAEELVVTLDSELYRILNLHYNRNNQIEVPDNFRVVVQTTLREFFNAVKNGKDQEPSWKKPVYKVIARLDDALPEYFKSPNWMEQLGDS